MEVVAPWLTERLPPNSLGVNMSTGPQRSAEVVVVDVADRLARLIPEQELVDVCHRWQVRELSVFGSVLRDDFSAGSDIDVLVSFDPAAPWSLWDLTTMQDQFRTLCGRPVDRVEYEGLRNPFRRERILNSRTVLYAAEPR
jgi:predicted nucleotidyltransferase